MIQLVSVRPTASPETDTLYKVLMGPVTLNQSGAKEMRAAQESEQSGECLSTLCSKQNVHFRVMWRLNHIIGHNDKRILVKL